MALFNAELRGCHNRIMLSPVLPGEKTWKEIVPHDTAWYEERGVACRFVARGQDRHRRKLRCACDELVIATGSQAFIILLPGHDRNSVIG